MTKVTIIGCGWLGLPLGKHLVEKGYRVIGTTTSADKLHTLMVAGIEAYPLKLNPDLEGEFPSAVFQSDVIIINIPPGQKQHTADFHIEQIHTLRSLIEQGTATKIVFVSATSVYPNVGTDFLETEKLSTENTGNIALFAAEDLIRASKKFQTTILRLGGLLGYNRIPGRHFAGKSDIDGTALINYIHRDDAIGFIEFIINQNLWNEVYNVKSPIERTRREVFERNIRDFNLEPIEYALNLQGSPRRISAHKIEKSGYSFLYPDPLDFLYQLS